MTQAATCDDIVEKHIMVHDVSGAYFYVLVKGPVFIKLPKAGTAAGVVEVGRSNMSGCGQGRAAGLECAL